MTIEYEYTVEEYLALVRFHRRRMKRQWFLPRLGYSLFIGLLAYSLLYIVTGYSIPIVLALSLPVVVLFYLLLPHLALSNLRSTYAKQCDPVYEVELTAVSDGLVISYGHNEFKTRWEGIGDILGDGDHTFIYRQDGSVYVIPHRRITYGNYVLFLQELAHQMEAHTPAPLANASSASPTGINAGISRTVTTESIENRVSYTQRS